jgi:hypothetical protein
MSCRPFTISSRHTIPREQAYIPLEVSLSHANESVMNADVTNESGMSNTSVINVHHNEMVRHE